VVDFAPDSVSYGLTIILLSVGIWTGFEILLFDESVLVAAVSGLACGLAIVLVTRQQYDPQGE
jgi:hypothetical protein